MQDRISNHPNRWVLTPVAGETNTYDFTRADDPTVAGTPLNKATFLPDATAAAVEAATGESGIALPADALDAIATFLSGIGSTTNIGRVVTGSYTGAGGTTTTKKVTLTFPFKPRFFVVVKGTQFVNIMSLQYCIAWMYGLTQMNANVPTTYDGDKTLSWSCDTNTAENRPIYRMDEAGVTYYYIAIGVD